ncbi:hypothetical protein BU090_09630 [Staphylococcus warneri]|uniref:hypothetical protein n=1 Tax=Staphylococcus warneri TaxID=1292 RepID=UPI000D1D2721|nr:hypothetical protein [Staphylococcus warneri]PTI59804.1 hypothetical protein BU090_09630 [Staphylococcus warneri]
MTIDTNYKGEMVCDYELLTRFNPNYINTKIAVIEQDIESMYDRTYPHLVGDNVVGSIYYESFSLDHLAIDIMEQKDKLAKYKRKSKQYLKYFYTVLDQYTSKEKRIIKSNISNHHIPDTPLFERFKCDLYDYIARNREQQSKQIEKSFDYIPLNKRRQSSYIHQYTLNEEKEIAIKEENKRQKNMNINDYQTLVGDYRDKKLIDFIDTLTHHNTSMEQAEWLETIVSDRVDESELRAIYYKLYKLKLDIYYRV